ncbi:hypothetical protein AWR27_11150 [Spirosoma montaniterrae]|uniref:Carbohydrate-binding domain-containing protein n=2 Tax=Spirosoma montaniterrae TaxID=1178516 RepID=A0A1P9X470_9BACT|nr:hypothetical protein AWR27_11150 [Spirosoma montaniterrae]
MGGVRAIGQTQPADSTSLTIRPTDDFTVNGLGDHPAWAKTDWLTISAQKARPKPLTTRAKLLYSTTGLYVLFRCDDETLTATIETDYGPLYNEDVVEIFLWPDTSVPIYFEYELSPLNYELPLLVPNLNNKFMGWKPWQYGPRERVQHATSAWGGDKRSRASVSGWVAEFFIPYRLLSPIVQTPPNRGTRWRGNLYRIDYDRGYATWAWQKTGGSFHEFGRFGTLIFE